MIPKATGSARSRLERCRETTRVALIGDGITQYGIERWFALKSEEEIEAKTVDIYLTYLGALLDILFGILPAIRYVRHEILLEHEREREVQEAAKGTTHAKLPVADSEALEAIDTLDLVDSNLREVRRIPLHSPAIEKSALRLEQWSREAALRNGIAQQADNAEVRKTQEAISKKLGTFTDRLPTFIFSCR